MAQQLDMELLDLKPHSCEFCYWRDGRKRICRRDSCYYERPVELPPPSECDECPYRGDHPCIGWCTKEIIRKQGLLPVRKEK